MLHHRQEGVWIGYSNPGKGAKVRCKDGAGGLVVIDLFAQVAHETSRCKGLSPDLHGNHADQKIDGGEDSFDCLSFGKAKGQLERLGNLRAVSLKPDQQRLL